MADDRTPGELGIGPDQHVTRADPPAAAPDLAGVPEARRAGAQMPTEAMCQKADWLAETTELPTTVPPTTVPPTAELPAVPPTAAAAAVSASAGSPAEPVAQRLRRWGREYGGYLAAGGLAAVVLSCAMTGLPNAVMTWHSGSPVAASSSPATVRSSPAPVPSVTSASGTSATPSRGPTKRPVAAAKPRANASSARSATPTPSPAVLGPASATALAGIVDDYCDRRFDRSAVLLRPWPGSGAEDNWACQRRRRHDPIVANMTEVCALRYGNGAVARYQDARDPFSWRCYREQTG